MSLYLFFIFIFGLIFGSFISALSWRMPRGIQTKKGRSVCDECDYQLTWKDNIPLLSYLLLKGKCRSCKKKISLRYPLIEIFTGLTFLLIGYVYFNCSHLLFIDSPVCFWKQTTGLFSLPYLLIISVIMITIFVIDLEHQIIPDRLNFALFAIVFITIFIFDVSLWDRLFAGFAAGLFLLILHLITLGKGMGLGDSKLAIPVGMFFGMNLMISWMFMSFLIGAVIGVFLIALNKAKFGKHIAFGPFLLISFFLTRGFGGFIESCMFFY